MMEKLIEMIQAVEGVDETGEAKAFCNIGIQRGTNEDDLVVEADINTMNAVVSLCFTEVWVMVDLCFENRFDYDLIQITQLCTEYVEMVKSEMGKDYKPLSLVVSLAPAGEYDGFIIGTNGFWCLMPREIGGDIDTIRFIFPVQDFGVYELSEEAVEQMVEEVYEELDENE